MRDMNRDKSPPAVKVTIWAAEPLQTVLDLTEVPPDELAAEGREKSREAQASKGAEPVSISRRLNRFADRILWALRKDPPLLQRATWDALRTVLQGRTELLTQDIARLPEICAATIALNVDHAARNEILAEIDALSPLQRLGVTMVIEMLEGAARLGDEDMELHDAIAAVFAEDRPIGRQC